MLYQQKWLLAVALKRPYPSPYETGAQETTEVIVDPSAMASYVQAMASVRTVALVGGVIVGVVGGLIGYAIGASK